MRRCWVEQYHEQRTKNLRTLLLQNLFTGCLEPSGSLFDLMRSHLGLGIV